MILIIKRSLRILLIALLSSLVSGCAGGTVSQDSSLTIFATTSVLGDIVSQVVGDNAEIDVLMPVGVDPHSYSPSSGDIAAMSRADLVIGNGLGLEASLTTILDEVASDTAVLLVAPLVDPLPFGAAVGVDHDSHDGDDPDGADRTHEGDSDGGSLDPHFWTDPVRVGEAARAIAAALTKIDQSVDWARKAEEFAAMLESVDAEIEELLDSIPSERRHLVTNHDSLGYFADRYGFEIVGTVIPGGSTLGDPSSEALAQLVEVMRGEMVTVLFADTTNPTRLAEALAAELGADVSVVSLFTGSLGPAGSGADTVADMLRANAELIATSLTESG